MKRLTAEQKLTKARTAMLIHQPFFGALALRMKWLPNVTIPTMATDGTHVYYSPEFVEKLPDHELIGVCAHEVLHPALAHHARRGDRHPELWNIAADYAINPMIRAAGLKLPDWVLSDARFVGMCAEEIYAILLNEAIAAGRVFSVCAAGGSGLGNMPETAGGIGQVLDAVGENGGKASPAEMARQAHEWQIATEQAARQAKNQGKLPEMIERALGEAKQERVNWRAVLRRFLEHSTPSDYSWTRPNRRFVGSGIYLPSMIRENLGTIAVMVDTSGSVGAEELAQFSAELTAMVRDARPELVYVVYCDARVNGVEEFTANDEVVLKPLGGGGTDFRPPFAWLEEQGIRPRCAIYLTDLYCDSYPDEPEFPVLWATDSKHLKAPWGETVYLEVA